MSTIMQGLHQDHVHLAKLLELLKAELELLRRGERPNYDQMLDIVDYVQNYPDQVHHPKEDVVLRYYLARGGDSPAVVEALMAEHKALPELTKELRESVEKLLHDGIVSLEAFESQLQRFIEAQHSHMSNEEGKVFPMIERTLTDTDWAAIEREIPQAGDPLFGENVARQYEGLYQRVIGGVL